MNIEIETSLAAWFRAQPAFDGIPVHTGQSADPIPNDQPILIVGVNQTDVVVPTLYKSSISIVAATPCFLENALELHSSITGHVRSVLLADDLLADSFEPPLHLAGAVLTSVSESREAERWLTTASLTLGFSEQI